MQRKDPQLISEVIESTLAAEGRSTLFARQRASYLWCEIVGPGVNRRTSRRYVDGSVLHVYITSAALKNELSFLRRSIVRQINEALGSEVLTDIMIH